MTSDLQGMVRTVAALFIDYLRWTQFVPMLMAWAFILLALGLMALVNFQEQGFTVVERLIILWDRYSWLPRLDGAVDPTEAGGLTLNEEGFRSLVVSFWAGLSVVLFLLSLLGQAIFGPREPVPFTRKLRRTLLPAGLVWLGFVPTYLFGSETFQGGPVIWLFGFTLACALVLAVSAYSLGVGALLERVRSAIQPGNEVAKSPSATRLEATGELNTAGVVDSPGTMAGMGRQGISPPHRGSRPISLESMSRQGPLPPGGDLHEGS
jgi:hypothetical protein